ncbi:MAG: shikimate dehydrogenase [Acidimicrobiia bacterium]|nr:shikimate dehydrogenase [Acidimicrobiia bacterium]
MADSFRLALLGNPVRHSRSPAMHNAALRTLGLAGAYEALRVDHDGMVGAAHGVRSGHFDGANITMPHKQLAFDLADSLSVVAQRAGAVNTWVRSAGRLEGHNTDVDGIVRAWDSASFPSDAPVLILGSGGAAAAACLALHDRKVLVAARRMTAVDEMVHRLGVDATAHPWGVPLTGAVIVNATPIGMHGESLPTAVVARASGLFDMTYGDIPSPAIEAGSALGIPTLDGREMLLGQAMASFTLWTGYAAPEAAMRAALDG